MDTNLVQTLKHELGALRQALGAVADEIDRIAARITDLEELLIEQEPEIAPLVVSPVLPDAVPEVDAPAPAPEASAPAETAADTMPSAPATAVDETDATPSPVAVDLPAVSSTGRLRDIPELPEVALYDWQQEALEAWNASGYVGVVEAVTGAGKTHVGLAAMADALAFDHRRVVVMTPSTALVNQWAVQVRQTFPGLKVSTDAARSPGWHVLIDTVQTLSRRSPLWPGESALIIADEVHRYGAPTFAQALRPGFGRRLGLTATYERGDEGDQRLADFFRDVSFRLGYARALAEKVIAPFRVAQVGVRLDADERSAYEAATATLAKASAAITDACNLPEDLSPFELFTHVTRLMGLPGHPAHGFARAYIAAVKRRQDLLAEASGKMTALNTLAPTVAASGGSIVFTQTRASARRAAETLQAAGCSSASVHGSLDDGEREERLDLFRTGQVSSISAPRLLDEGVDVPDADLAVIVAANRSRRQMIQRLGRVVRTKQDGREARCVIMFAIDTVEDPGVEEVPPHLAEILENATAVGRFISPDESVELSDFLAY